MPPNSKYTNGLNEKQCWDIWWKYNTLREAAAALAEEGIVNTHTGKPYTHFGVQIAAWRYAMKNIPEAKEDFRRDYEKRGVPFDEYEEKEFYKKLVRAARNIYRVSPSSFEKWLTDNHLEEYRQYA